MFIATGSPLPCTNCEKMLVPLPLPRHLPPSWLSLGILQNEESFLGKFHLPKNEN